VSERWLLAATVSAHPLFAATTISLIAVGTTKRAHGSAPARKAPTLTPDVLAMLAALPDSLQGTRDRAVILTGFAGAFRRSELAALDLANIAFSGDGATITLRRSKTDQDGEGRKVGIPFGSHGRSCPVLALRAWIEAAGIEQGRWRSLTVARGYIRDDSLFRDNPAGKIGL
jgi:integrase